MDKRRSNHRFDSDSSSIASALTLSLPPLPPITPRPVAAATDDWCDPLFMAAECDGSSHDNVSIRGLATAGGNYVSDQSSSQQAHDDSSSIASSLNSPPSPPKKRQCVAAATDNMWDAYMLMLEAECDDSSHDNVSTRDMATGGNYVSDQSSSQQAHETAAMNLTDQSSSPQGYDSSRDEHSMLHDVATAVAADHNLTKCKGCNSYVENNCCNCNRCSATDCRDWGTNTNIDYNLNERLNVWMDFIANAVSVAYGFEDIGLVLSTLRKDRPLPLNGNYYFGKVGDNVRLVETTRPLTYVVRCCWCLLNMITFAEKNNVIADLVNMFISSNNKSDKDVVVSLSGLSFATNKVSSELSQLRQQNSVFHSDSTYKKKIGKYIGSSTAVDLLMLEFVIMDYVFRPAIATGLFPTLPTADDGLLARLHPSCKELIQLVGESDRSGQSIQLYIAQMFGVGVESPETKAVTLAVYDSKQDEVHWLNLMLVAHLQHLKRSVIRNGKGFEYHLCGTKRVPVRVVDMRTTPHVVEDRPTWRHFNNVSETEEVDIAPIMIQLFLGRESCTFLPKPFSFNFSDFGTDVVTLRHVLWKIHQDPERLEELSDDTDLQDLVKKIYFRLKTKNNEEGIRNARDTAALLSPAR